jgi:ATP-dependent Clp protease ATP-binding subunit ClpC
MQGETSEFGRVTEEARTIARAASQPLSTTHLLLSLFAVPNSADLVLRSHRVDEETILSRFREMPREEPGIFDQVVTRARETALGTGTEARALHLLLALARQKCVANDLLVKCGLTTAELAREVLSYVVGPIRRLPYTSRARPLPRPSPARRRRCANRSSRAPSRWSPRPRT